MKIKLIKLKDFKRFTDLTIESLPETAKLVVMIGPNGCGKSSVFDALQVLKNRKGFNFVGSVDYYLKSVPRQINFTFDDPDENVQVEFHERSLNNREDWQSALHIRSAYRNDLVDEVRFGNQFSPIREERRFYRMIENDQAVTSNYSRLMNQLMERSSASDQREKTVGDLQDEIFGELRAAIDRLFSDPELIEGCALFQALDTRPRRGEGTSPAIKLLSVHRGVAKPNPYAEIFMHTPQLILDSLGNPAEDRIFEFNKGASQGLSYQNLSSGEKAALDLLLDLTVVKVEFNDTVFCIDEPEAHIHTKLQGPLLHQLYKLIPDNSQLWIATHSIGMVRQAQDLWQNDPDSVVFLDFGKDEFGRDRNFDGPVKIEPATPNPNFWASTYEVALGDLAALVTPQQIVLCESKAQDPTKAFDAACYNQIFGSRYPDTRFISIGNDKEVERADTHLIPVIQAIATGTEIFRLRDGDDAIQQEIKENAEKGISTLPRRNIESYLFDDEVLTKLCEDHGKPDKIQDLLDAKQTALKKSIAEGGHPENLKPIAQKIHHAARNALKPSRMGNRKESFMRDILARLIQPGMQVYEELHKDIFGE